ncbi:hypothetical protein ACFU8I_37170, partial [Streptomyces sp. NPDC057540]
GGTPRRRRGGGGAPPGPGRAPHGVPPRGGVSLLLLHTHNNADFLSRVEAFDRAADTVEAWNAEYGTAPAATR